MPQLVVFLLTQAIYRVWFHPLAKFPGPRIQSLIHFPTLYKTYVLGTHSLEARDLHRKYGRAVRIGPNHLLLDGSIGWSQVFGHRKGKEEFSKQPTPFKIDELSIINSSLDIHRRQRRQLSHAFSDAALLEQEPVIRKYIDMLLQRFHDRAARKEPVDVVSWFNFITFDIIGDLAYSESFDGLKNNGYHPWVASVFEALRGISMSRFQWYYPGLMWLNQTFTLSNNVTTSFKVREHTYDKALARIRQGTAPAHKDFVSYMMRKTRDGADGMDQEETVANAPLLILAGSETTATALSGFCFYTRQNTDAYDFLAQEIRAAFDSKEDINLRNTTSLVYLQACINEILRVYPPAAVTQPRISPGEFVQDTYLPPGAS
ncbi:hypothetical protein CDD82_3615 [Ophiocordyceps australis]|uniref:Cytochrome P450 n=1 Tax=Ophiocordyceps australis TaxID=1399860 RepID=A0A2C5ZTC3_9HYPO|nr:hypothetical protein CDD82_3615 [Ophiocordyceps australis]